MNEAEKKLLESGLSKLYKLDKEALSGLYNEDGELINFDAVISANETKIAKLSEEKDNQYKRGLKEGAVKFEKYIKDKYEVESETDGTNLVDALVDKTIASASDKEVDVEKHPKFIELKSETDKRVKEAIKEKEKEFEAEKKEWTRKETISNVKSFANSFLDTLNPILPEDIAKAESWRKTYLREFEVFDYQPKDGNFKEAVVLKEGKVYEDAHGNSVKLNELAKNIADKYFEYKAADDRSSAGNKEGGEKNITFRDREDYTKQVAAAKGDTQKQSELASAAMKQGLV